ncbi:hypothetical protein [uncultured Streptococcus sp.]|uniref:hypothetical protein n=1 Tax=uncultured Streptococcus sp. TaxID=83427 RepID=UPI0025D396D5|nr:hypothetical protein [uncultured Streptococcus sp.]
MESKSTKESFIHKDFYLQLFITDTSLLVGDDLRVQDNHLVSDSLWLLLEIEKAATS